MTNILNSIVEYKASIVGTRKKIRPLSLVKEKAAEQTHVRGFVQALEAQLTKRQPAVIAECKKGSPSKGIIVPTYDAKTIALAYEKAGAACISVLTDEKFFHGGDQDLSSVKKVINIPVLRKDFIIDTYQVYETKAMGADCILLIAACLSDKLLDELFQVSTEIGLDVLVEVHDRTELERALRLRGPLIGINNRNLKLFETNIDPIFVECKLCHNFLKWIPINQVDNCDSYSLGKKTSIPKSIYFFAISGVIDTLFSKSLFSDIEPIIIKL